MNFIFTKKIALLGFVVIFLVGCGASNKKMQNTTPPSTERSSADTVSRESSSTPPTAEELEFLKQAVRENNVTLCEKIKHKVLFEQCRESAGKTQ